VIKQKKGKNGPSGADSKNRSDQLSARNCVNSYRAFKLALFPLRYAVSERVQAEIPPDIEPFRINKAGRKKQYFGLVIYSKNGHRIACKGWDGSGHRRQNTRVFIG